MLEITPWYPSLCGSKRRAPSTPSASRTGHALVHVSVPSHRLASRSSPVRVQPSRRLIGRRPATLRADWVSDRASKRGAVPRSGAGPRRACRRPASHERSIAAQLPPKVSHRGLVRARGHVPMGQLARRARSLCACRTHGQVRFTVTGSSAGPSVHAREGCPMGLRRWGAASGSWTATANRSAAASAGTSIRGGPAARR